MYCKNNLKLHKGGFSIEFPDILDEDNFIHKINLNSLKTHFN